MAKYRKKPIVIEATQWSKDKYHTNVKLYNADCCTKAFPLSLTCPQCKVHYNDHGAISTLEGNMVVCPGDWIITGVKGEVYPCKDDIFRATYEEVKPEEEELNKPPFLVEGDNWNRQQAQAAMDLLTAAPVICSHCLASLMGRDSIKDEHGIYCNSCWGPAKAKREKHADIFRATYEEVK